MGRHTLLHWRILHKRCKWPVHAVCVAISLAFAGRPTKRAPKKKKDTTVVFEESRDSDYSVSESSSSEEEVVYMYVQRISGNLRGG